MNEPVIETGTGDAPTIAAQNDLFRLGIDNPGTGIPGRVVTTPGVSERGPEFQLAALRAVAAFDSFDEDDDPYCEHDFGTFELDGATLFWKIDLYDPGYRFGSENPVDIVHTRRVLTIMLASEY